MAVDVCSSSEPFISPRISFSHDLNNQSSSETATIAAISTAFDFCITPNPKLPITSADELFLNGVLLPTQIKKPKAVIQDHRKRLKELLSENEDKEGKTSSRSFWKFTRTTSLNSCNGTVTKGLLRSLSLKRLLHSSSTLSKSNSQKDSTMSSSCFSSVHTPSLEPLCCNGSDSRRRSLTKKDSGGGIQINPVLNISTAYNMNLFGYSSLFSKGKTKNKTN